MSLRDRPQYPTRSGEKETVTWRSYIPVGSGGAPIGSGWNATPTGNVGVPSGAWFQYHKLSPQGATVTLIAGQTARYRYAFAQSGGGGTAVGGYVRAFLSLSVSGGPGNFSPMAIGFASGYADIQSLTPSGTPGAPSAGDVICFEMVAKTVGNIIDS
jgi:hypothetical protein